MANGGVMGQPHIANEAHPFVQQRTADLHTRCKLQFQQGVPSKPDGFPVHRMRLVTSAVFPSPSEVVLFPSRSMDLQF